MESPDTLRFGPFALDLRSHELWDGDRRVRLQEQPFEILRLLLERRGDIVDREVIRRRLWPDGTSVDFEHSVNAAIRRLRIALGDAAGRPRFVETVPRRGYRLLDILEDTGAPAVHAAVLRRRRVVVLPFTTLSDERGQEYFSDGLTEELIVQLGAACPNELAVVSRSSSMFFKGGSQRAAEICRALGADYLLEGSARHEGARVRITARLVDAANEAQLWSAMYDRTVDDWLAVQSDVAGRVALALSVALLPDERPACLCERVTDGP